MHRRRFLASILGLTAAASARRERKLHVDTRKPSLRERRIVLGFDPPGVWRSNPA